MAPFLQENLDKTGRNRKERGQMKIAWALEKHLIKPDCSVSSGACRDGSHSICSPLILSRQTPRNTRPYPKCSQMSMEIHDKQQDSSSALTDSTEKVLNSEYPEFYSSTVILLLILREGKRGCVAGLFGIKDRTRIVQEAELFMVAARHVALKRPPHGALRFSRTRVQGFSGIPALEMSVNSSGSTQN